MRTIFFGTPLFAVPTLEAMVAADLAPLLVIAQPSRPVGRRKELKDPPVIAKARELGLPVAQPETVRQREFLDQLRQLEPDVAVVVAYGQIFRRTLLRLPRHGCLNLHGSLLPKYRGAAPIQAAIAAGDEITGVTAMRMARGLDSGPMLLRRELRIGPDETTAQLAPRLAQLGAETMVDTLQGLAAGELRDEPQDDAAATYAPQLTRADGEVDWQLTARQIYDRWRAYTPWPGMSAELEEQPLKLVELAPRDELDDNLEPGTIRGLQAGAIEVVCGGGTILAALQVQRPGKKAVRAADFFNGERLQAGDRFHRP